MKKYRLLFIVICFSITVLSQDKPRKWSLNGYVKNMQSIMFSQPNSPWVTDNLIHNRLNFSWYINDEFTFTTHLRNRLFWGEMTSTYTQYTQAIDTQTGFFDLSENIIKKTSVICNSTIDRLFLSYTKNKWQIIAGRQRINWGQTFAWNPNDIFNAYSFFDFDYEEKPGSDAIRAIYYPSYVSQIEFAAKLNAKDELTAAALWRFNKWSYDWQFIGGILNQKDAVLGIGWSGQLKNMGFRGEASYFNSIENPKKTNIFTAVTGCDYTFKNSLSLQFEALYNSNGNKSQTFNMQNMYYLDISAKNLSLNQWSLFLQTAYTISPLINGAISTMYSPNDNSVFIGPSVSASISNNSQVSVNVQSFLSTQTAVSGTRGTFVFLRFKWGFDIS